MGFIKCVDCGEMLSEDLKMCPKCYTFLEDSKEIYEKRAVSDKLKKELIQKGKKIITAPSDEVVTVKHNSIVHMQRIERPNWRPTVVCMQKGDWIDYDIEGLRLYDVYEKWENETYQIINIERDLRNYDPYNGWQDLAPGLNNSAKWNGNDFYPARGRKGKL